MGFSPEWLSLREPADKAARNQDLLRTAARLAGDQPVIMDLGCGTGSTVRALSAFLPSNTLWRLVDHDETLLQAAQGHVGPGSTTHLADIDQIASLPLEGVTLVTASALLDLVTQSWVERFAATLQVPFYAALSYNGQMSWDPPLPQDDLITEAFNRHQRTDKGLGSALGPASVQTAHSAFEAAGATVQVAESPWQLGAEAIPLQQALISGIASAAHEMGEPSALAWGETRIAAAPTTHCTIGHYDILAVPAPRGGA